MPLQQTHFSVRGILIEPAVFGLDRWLRQRQGVFEFTDHPRCLFRIQRAHAETEVVLADGTRLAPGDTILNLHLWNEHVPPIGPDGPTVLWGRALARGVDLSLRELARYLRWTRGFDDAAALRGDMRLGDANRSAQLARIAAYYGFESTSEGIESGTAGHRLAENVFMMLLVLASNPAALRAPVLRRTHTPVYMPRVTLMQRYETRGRSGPEARLC